MRSTPVLISLLGASLALGCSSASTGDATVIDAQLEALAVVGPADYAAVAATGKLRVSGADRDFALEVAAPSGPFTFTVHTPGASALGALDGRAVTAALSSAGLHQERSVILSDALGPLYVSNVGRDAAFVDAVLGAGFATWGATLATSSDDTYDWTYTAAVFKSDAGVVSVAPGSTATLTVGGALWRVAVIAAYKLQAHPGAALRCGGLMDMLSYELLRVEAAPAPAKLTRKLGGDLAFLGCR